MDLLIALTIQASYNNAEMIDNRYWYPQGKVVVLCETNIQVARIHFHPPWWPGLFPYSDSLNFFRLASGQFETLALSTIKHNTMADSSGAKPPTRQQRQVCWKLRDEYFACLDRLNIVDPVAVEKDPEQAKDCLESKKKYEDACMASWVCFRVNDRELPLNV